MMTHEGQAAKVIAVTGVTAGIGKACAEQLMQAGYRVYGGARRVPPEGTYEKAGAGFIRSLPLDVTQPASVERFVSEVVAAEGGLMALVHAAGYTLSGAVEEVSPEEALAQFQTNFFGAHNLYRAVLPVMRKQGAGRIITVGSVAGLFAVPFQAMYSASKYALEALTEATRMEALPFGVKVTLVDPGDVRTEFTNARRWAAAAEDQSSPYWERGQKAVQSMARSEQAGPGPEVVARAVLSVLGQPNPPVRVVVGAQWKAVAFVRPLVPLKLLHRLLMKIYS